MTNKQTYELLGKITHKKSDKVRSKQSKHYNNPFFRLEVDIVCQEEITEILAFECWLEDKSKWEKMKQLELKDYLDKKFLFKVQRKPGAGKVFRLLD